MDPGLAGVTAYVSQDCTGMKDELLIKTGYCAHTDPFSFHHLALLLGDYEEAWKGDRRLTVSITQQIHQLQNL